MYGKHFEGMYTGSMYGGGLAMFAVWGYIIATTRPVKDEHGVIEGIVEVNPVHLAGILGCEASEVEKVLKKLQEPDERSRSPEENGAKLVREGQFQYRVVNWSRYRDIRDEEARREYNREKQAQYRARKAERDANRTVT